MRTYGNDKKSAYKAITDAQKIAFAPIMFQAAKALRDFGILSLLEQKKGVLIEEIASNVKLSKYGTLVLLEAGLSLEMVRVENDKYFITKTGWAVNSNELTKVNMDFTNDINYKGAFHLQEAVQTGKPSGLHNEFGKWKTVYEALPELSKKNRESWFAFDHFYSDGSFRQIMSIVFKNNPKKILDIGGNTGKFAIKCAKYNNDVEITILDLPGQLKDAKKNIKKEKIENKIKCIPINLLDFQKKYPKYYDIIWMSQFLDCFSEIEIIKLLKNAKNAMNNNSELLIMETLWDKQKHQASIYSLHAVSLYFTCIANGNSRMYHSEDMIKLIEKAGLNVIEIIENIGISHTILRCKI